jgi:putative methyltransferase (TIGR04325 family)
LDFGGSFGTSYYQHLDFLKHIDDLHWSVVEQQNYVDYGKNHFETKELKFFKTYEEATKHNSPNLLYLSCVLPYLEKPYEILKELIALKIPYVILNRNQFRDGPTKLTVQKTTKMTFPASFPCWIFNKKEMLGVFSDYEILREFRGPENEGVYYGGALLVLKK